MADEEKKYKLYRNVVVDNGKIGYGVSVGDDSVIVNSVLEDHVEIDRRNYIHNSVIGCCTYTGMNTYIGMSKIGKFCSISRSVDIGGADHNYSAVTMYPDEKMIRNIMKQDYEIDKRESVQIGNDVWIGQGATIIKKRGISIGDGVIIGAGSLVNKDIPDYAIAVGIPVHIIKYRFELPIIKELKKIEWWDFPFETIKDNWDILSTEITPNTIDKLWRIKELLN